MGLGEKKKLVNEFIFRGLRRDVCLKIAKISKHQYYYQPKKSKQGIKPTFFSKMIDENEKIKEISNEKIIDQMKQIHQDLDTDYGYRKMAAALKLKGFIINHKKVYRLMKSVDLLKEKHEKPSKKYAKYRKVFPSQPYEVLEYDIKFVWVEEYKRHVYILTVIDTFTRVVLHWYAGYYIKKEQVKQIWEQVIINHLQPNNCLEKKISIEVRNDNDSRFSAKIIQDFFEENSLNQVFTHPYTPQENGHIESFHAILSKKLKPHLFFTIEELEIVLTLFYEKYNNVRLHASTCYLPPNLFLRSL
jgi:transposase InsO family protein